MVLAHRITSLFTELYLHPVKGVRFKWLCLVGGDVMADKDSIRSGIGFDETATDQDQEEQIESTLVYDTEKYDEHEPYERVAEGIHERGRRKMEYIYDIDHEGAETTLRVYTRYYLDGELENESCGSAGAYPVRDSQDLHEFIEDNFNADPEVSLGDEWESMVYR